MPQTTETQAIQSLFHILNKDGVKVPFILSPAQLFLDSHDNPFGRSRLIIAKARQKGFSRGILAKFTVRCLGREGIRATVLSHENKSTQRLLGSAHYFLKHMNGPRPTLGTDSRIEMTFPLRDSAFYIGTAGSRTFGRGDTITDLHCSEYAFWEGTENFTAGLFQAVPYNGRIYIESTGNGRNNDFYYTWTHAEQMGFTKIFFPWFADDEYSLPVTKQWTPQVTKHAHYLLEIKEKFNLSDQQMFWYDWKLGELRENLQMMQQEYPSEPEECFQATGGSIFPDVKHTYSGEWKHSRFGALFVHKHFSHPIEGFHYVIGADPSGGTGNDDAAIVIGCVETGEQVLELADNTLNPIRFSRALCDLGFAYNEAFIVCESNNHGAAIIPYLRDNYPRHKIYKRKLGTSTQPPLYGWNNSDTAKHALIGLMQEELDSLYIHGQQTCNELLSFEEDANGRMGSRSDNLVIATGLMLLGMKKYSHYRDEYHKPQPSQKQAKPDYTLTSFEEIMENIRQRQRQIDLFTSQAGRGYPYN